MVGELGFEAIQEAADRKLDDLRTDDPGLELVDVEQRIQHARHCAQRLIELGDQPGAALVGDPLREYPAQEAQGLQRLTQIVAGGRGGPRLFQNWLVWFSAWRPP